MATAIEPVERSQLIKHPHVVMSVGVVAILMVMLLPLPRFLLDLLLSFDITLSLIILLPGLQVRRPIEGSGIGPLPSGGSGGGPGISCGS